MMSRSVHRGSPGVGSAGQGAAAAAPEAPPPEHRWLLAPRSLVVGPARVQVTVMRFANAAPMQFRASNRITGVEATTAQNKATVFGHVYAAREMWATAAETGAAELIEPGTPGTPPFTKTIFHLPVDAPVTAPAVGAAPVYVMTVEHVQGDVRSLEASTPELGMSKLTLPPVRPAGVAAAPPAPLPQAADSVTAQRKAIRSAVPQGDLAPRAYLEAVVRASLRAPSGQGWSRTDIGAVTQMSRGEVNRMFTLFELDPNEVAAVESWAKQHPDLPAPDLYRRSLADNASFEGEDRYPSLHLGVIHRLAATTQDKIDFCRSLDSPRTSTTRLALGRDNDPDQRHASVLERLRQRHPELAPVLSTRVLKIRSNPPADEAAHDAARLAPRCVIGHGPGGREEHRLVFGGRPTAIRKAGDRTDLACFEAMHAAWQEVTLEKPRMHVVRLAAPPGDTSIHLCWSTPVYLEASTRPHRRLDGSLPADFPLQPEFGLRIEVDRGRVSVLTLTTVGRGDIGIDYELPDPLR